MSTRFEAEAMIRAAASGAIPSPGDVLIRVENGWVFANLVGTDGSVGGEGSGLKNIFDHLFGDDSDEGPEPITFLQIVGVIQDSQVPESAVTQHEAALTLSFTQLTDQIADGQVPESAVAQYLGDILNELRRQAQQDDFLFALTRRRSVADKLYLDANYG